MILTVTEKIAFSLNSFDLCHFCGYGYVFGHVRKVLTEVNILAKLEVGQMIITSLKNRNWTNEKFLLTKNWIDVRIYGCVQVGQMNGFLHEKTLDR